eukprot:1155956-Pelagomonas_calceolata.AAC.18
MARMSQPQWQWPQWCTRDSGAPAPSGYSTGSPAHPAVASKSKEEMRLFNSITRISCGDIRIQRVSAGPD